MFNHTFYIHEKIPFLAVVPLHKQFIFIFGRNYLISETIRKYSLYLAIKRFTAGVRALYGCSCPWFYLEIYINITYAYKHMFWVGLLVECVTK